MSSEFKFSIPVEIRFSDIDFMGHVNNAVYFTYMELARVRYLQQLGIISPSLQDTPVILAEASCQFEYAVRFADGLVVKLRTSEMKNSSFIMEYRLETRDGRLAAVGRTVQVYYDYQNRTPTPIPPQVRKRIREFEGWKE